MTAGPGRLVLVDAGIPVRGAWVASVRDRLLGLGCVAKYAPSESPAGHAVDREGLGLADLEHPWLAPVVLRFREDEAVHLPDAGSPVAGFAVEWSQARPITEALAGTPPEVRVRAVAQVLVVLEYLHRRGVLHLRMSPQAIQLRGSGIRVLHVGNRDLDSHAYMPPELPDGEASPASDLYSVGVIARELLAGARLPIVDRLDALLAPNPADRPQSASEVLASIRETAGIHPWLHGAPPFLGRMRATTALVDALDGELTRPIAVLGPPGSGRTRLARRVLDRLATQHRIAVLDLSRTPDPLGAVQRLLVPDTSAAVAFDEEWIGRALRAIDAGQPWTGALFLGRYEEQPRSVRVVLERLAPAMAAAGMGVVWAAAGAPAGADPLPLMGLDATEVRRIATFYRVRPSPRVEAIRNANGGNPGPIARALHLLTEEGAGMQGSALQALERLSSLPTPIPAQAVPLLPHDVRRALPVLTKRGYARFDDEGRLSVDPPVQPGRPDPILADGLYEALSDPLGQLDPLWRARAYLAIGRPRKAAALFAEAVSVARDRPEALLDLSVALARLDEPGAIVAYAALQVDRGNPHDALVALSALDELGAEGRAVRIRALRTTGDRVRAAAEAAEAVRSEPVAPLWLELALSMLALGHLDQASDAIQHAAACHPPTPADQILAARASLALRRLDRGEATADVAAVVEQVEATSSPSPSVLGTAARILRRLGEHARAITFLSRAATLADGAGMALDATVHRLYLGLAAAHLGREDEARHAWTSALLAARSLGYAPLERRLREQLARLELRAGRLDDAEDHRAILERLARGDPNAATAAGIVNALCALSTGDHERALLALDSVRPETLTGPRVLDYVIPRAIALLESGRLAEARQLVDAAPTPSDPSQITRLLWLRGRVYIAQGRHYLREARDRLPEAPKPLEQREVGEILLAWAGDELDPRSFPERARDLERAAKYLTGPAAERAEAIRERMVATARHAVVPRPHAPGEISEVLGVKLSNTDQVWAIGTTLEMLDPDKNNNLLLTGPTGVGKRVFAERLAVEKLGLTGLEELVLRRTDPQMLVSMLMGTKKGEFTGALDQPGAIQRALQGRKALLLDELHTLDRAGQEILLPLLELPRRRFGGLMRSARDLGGPLQIILATNVDVSGARWRDLFRSDLWYRMSQMHVHLPPLSERGTEAIYQYLCEMVSEAGFQDPEEVLEPRAIYNLLAHPWEGNLRELHTVVQRITRYRRMYDRRINVPDLPRFSVGAELESIAPYGSRDVLETLLLNAVVEALRRCDWNQTAAAERLAISKYRLHRILQKHELLEWVRAKREEADSG